MCNDPRSCWDTYSGAPNPIHKVKRRRGSKPAAEQDTTTAIIKPRRSSPKLLLERITKNTIDSSPGEDPDLNEQNQPKGDIDSYARMLDQGIQRRETESSQVGKLRSNHWFIYKTHLHLYILAGQHTALRSNLQDSDL
ncbi:hypothetical protein PSHT_02885 [Puccinia striiformis]|uniref:Uncharacterized protein n=1 Tax=Puccinia striiformis TaxID=27350 RepID=A0A2S4WGZ5_9BASI|nr:hypothetical protein PSHT_02885 [Puccinia striiformis]